MSNSYRYFVLPFLPGDLIVHRRPKFVADPFGFESVFETEHFFIFLEMKPSKMITNADHVFCYDITNNEKAIPFSLNYGSLSLVNAHEWRLIRNEKEYRFQEDYGYP